jgi:hypothetical protein
MQKLINDEWIDCVEADLIAGDIYRISVGGGWQQQSYTEPNPDPIEIVITSITGALSVNENKTKVTCNELTNVTITGTLAIPDQLFSLPIRRDDGRLFLFPAQVTAGAFNVVVNFPTTGQFKYSDNECNVDLPYKMFTVNTVNLDVLRVV